MCLNKNMIMKQNILRLFSIIVVALFASASTFAQFYDEDSDIRFYKCVLLNGETKESGTRNHSVVFNFDGTKATTFGFNTTNSIQTILKRNINYFEGQVYGAKYDAKYREDLSNSSWAVYSRYSSGVYGLPSYTTYWYFSKDKTKMILKESGSRNEWTYKLVDKSFYIEEGRSRSNMKDDIIYE